MQDSLKPIWKIYLQLDIVSFVLQTDYTELVDIMRSAIVHQNFKDYPYYRDSTILTK